jgi:hypothetical protein
MALAFMANNLYRALAHYLPRQVKRGPDSGQHPSGLPPVRRSTAHRPRGLAGWRQQCTLPLGGDTEQAADFNSVACPESGSCVAVRNYTVQDGSSLPLTETAIDMHG